MFALFSSLPFPLLFLFLFLLTDLTLHHLHFSLLLIPFLYVFHSLCLYLYWIIDIPFQSTLTFGFCDHWLWISEFYSNLMYFYIFWSFSCCYGNNLFSLHLMVLRIKLSRVCQSTWLSLETLGQCDRLEGMSMWLHEEKQNAQ